jgi:hypothetical protein
MAAIALSRVCSDMKKIGAFFEKREQIVRIFFPKYLFAEMDPFFGVRVNQRPML